MIRRHHPDIDVVPYNITDQFEPIVDPSFDDARDMLYLVDYFSLSAAVTSKARPGTTVDNVQAFFRSPLAGAHTLYSARKFFGVPDGGYLYTDVQVPVPKPAIMWDRAAYLLKRLDTGAQSAYGDFVEAEKRLTESAVQGMSNLSAALIASIDMDWVRQSRLDNFRYLHAAVGHSNQLKVNVDAALLDPGFVPFTYPLLMDGGERTRSLLIEHNIYVPMYWAGVVTDPHATEFERHLARNTVHLPIDQRYSRTDMDLILRHLGFVGL
jgi:hypothetical protein